MMKLQLAKNFKVTELKGGEASSQFRYCSVAYHRPKQLKSK